MHGIYHSEVLNIFLYKSIPWPVTDGLSCIILYLCSPAFDDELSMMNDIAAYIRKNGMLLFNESFSSTNTREGSEIAMQITNALLENGIRIFFDFLKEIKRSEVKTNFTSEILKKFHAVFG